MADLCVSAAAVQLLFNHPFWVELYYSMKVIEDRNVKTLATDGKCIWVNPEFWKTMEDKYRVSALAHETGHKMLLHPTRGRLHLDPWRNIAMDILVNTMLKDNGFPIHPNWVQPEARFRGWTYEAIYHALMEEHAKPPTPPDQPEPSPEDEDEQEDGKDEADDAPEEEDGDEESEEQGEGEADPQDGEGEPDGDDEGGSDEAGEGVEEGASEGGEPVEVPAKYQGAWDDVKPFEGSDAQAEAFEEKVIEQVEKALESARAAGKAPKGMEGEIKKLGTPPEETWYDYLYRYFQELRRGEYNWYKPNRTMIAHFSVVAPTTFTEALGTTVIFRDASGSCMSPWLQGEFTDNINSILADVRPSKVYVVDFECGVTAIEEVEPGEMEFCKRPRGGGGTDFSDIFDYLEREGIVPDVAIVLTDMYGRFPDSEPEFPVIWASTSPEEVAPFGETIYIKTSGR